MIEVTMVNLIEIKEEVNIPTLTTIEFARLADKQESIYELILFADKFSCDEINFDSKFIRFI